VSAAPHDRQRADLKPQLRPPAGSAGAAGTSASQPGRPCRCRKRARPPPGAAALRQDGPLGRPARPRHDPLRPAGAGKMIVRVPPGATPPPAGTPEATD
jgi:hypothetical protein